MVALFRAQFPELAERFKRGWQSRGGGAEEPDVVCPWFHVEVKRQKRPNIKRALKQAEADTQGSPPVAFTKEDRGEWIVSMRPALFFDLIKAAFRL